MCATERVTCYKFLPVGQGLFATGSFETATMKRRFHWVYDCGTTSEQDLLNLAMAQIVTNVDAKNEGGKPRLDLVTVSHFDWDHISGLNLLLKRFSVGTLLLPYMPLWQRLIPAFSEGVDTQQELIKFLVNPVAYIAGLGDSQIDSIVFVPDNNEGPADEPAPGISETSDAAQGQSTLLFRIASQQSMNAGQKEDFDEFLREKSVGITSVFLLQAGTRLCVSGIWEFVPYNDAHIPHPPNSEFFNCVAEKRAALLGATSDAERKSTLENLRETYDNHFGKSPEMRNVISLFLYAGPIRDNKKVLFRRLEWDNSAKQTIRRYREWFIDDESADRSCILYTGDGYLNTKERLDRLIEYLHHERIRRLTCVQVMHHGAERNWHEGLAKQLAPDTSVFSSDPEHNSYKHPHGQVVRDFLPFGPVQVNKHCGLTLHLYAFK